MFEGSYFAFVQWVNRSRAFDSIVVNVIYLKF